MALKTKRAQSRRKAGRPGCDCRTRRGVIAPWLRPGSGSGGSPTSSASAPH